MIQVRRWMSRVIVVAAVMALATACGGAETDTTAGTPPDGVGAPEVRDGTFEGRIEAARDGTVEFDVVEVLSGEQAAAAREEDGEPPVEPGLDVPYVRDIDDGITTAPVADDVTVRVFDCSGVCELVEWSWDDLVAGRDLPYGPPDTVFEITIRDGEVVELREVYFA
jgi:hypothetical protein